MYIPYHSCTLPCHLFINLVLQQSFYETSCTFLRFVLKGFAKDGRDLTDAETKAFLKAADKDGDGKIGIDGEGKAHFII